MSAKFSYILLFLTTVFSYGQVTLVVASEDENLKVNERFTVTFILEISGNEYVQESPLKLPDLSKFNIVGTASNRDTYVDSKKNIVINRLVYQVVLEPKEAGKIKMGSALVQVSGKMYKTEPSDIFIKDAERRVNTNEDLASGDLYLNMEIKEKSVYTNQPTIAVLRAYSRDFDNFRKVGHIVLPNQNNVNFQTVSYKKSDIERNAGEMASQVIGVFMVFPTKSGKIEIEPISAKLKNKGTKIISNTINLNVKNLPAGSPANFKNAVGNFSLAIEKDSAAAEVNKPIKVVVKMKGQGNLVNIKIPAIVESENYRFYPPKISNNFVSGHNGMEGEITADYIIIPTKSGKISIETEQFAYFNPEEKKYINLGSKMLNINVLSHEQIVDSKTTLEKVNEYTNNILETVNSPVITTSALQIKEKNKLNWKTIFLNMGLFFGAAFLLFLVKRSYKKRKFITQNNSSSPIETIAEAEEKLKSQNRFSLEVELEYLEKLTEQDDSEKFFTAYEDMVKGFENQVVDKDNPNLNSYLENKYGKKTAEEFRMLSNKVFIEKYSPLITEEYLKNLYSEIAQMFSKISK